MLLYRRLNVCQLLPVLVKSHLLDRIFIRANRHLRLQLSHLSIPLLQYLRHPVQLCPLVLYTPEGDVEGNLRPFRDERS